MAFLQGSGVKLLDQLRDPLTQINKKAQMPLEQALERLGSRETASAKASGRVRSSYIPQELSRAGSAASRGIEDTLAGALGNASYDELLKQKEHERNLALAQEIGDLMSPSVLQQILSGLGGGARAGGQFYALYNQLGRGSGGGGGPGTQNSRLRLSNGWDYPSIPDFGYGR